MKTILLGKYNTRCVQKVPGLFEQRANGMSRNSMIDITSFCDFILSTSHVVARRFSIVLFVLI